MKHSCLWAVNRALAAAAAALLAFAPQAHAAARVQLPARVQCQFVLGFKLLHESLPDLVGGCRGDQGFTPSGDSQQLTTNGLLVWRKSDNFTAFTDGYRSWVNGPKGIQQRLNTQRFNWEASASLYKSGATGYDVSYPQCSRSGPPPGTFGAVGVTGGRPFSTNACAATEYSWASAGGTTPDLYFNTGFLDSYKKRISPGCQAAAPAGLDAGLRDAWAMGCSEAEYALARQPGNPAMWWLDVETENSWSDIKLLNQQAIQGAVSYLQQQTSGPVGVYSNPRMWGTITGGGNWTPAGLNGTWVAPGRVNAGSAPSFCGSSFTSAPTMLVQYVVGNYDANYAC